jgi:hypothetical protein
MLALLTRKNASTPAAPQQDTAPTASPVMQFLTQGGADVDLYPITWRVRVRQTEAEYEHRGFQWACRGCDTAGKDYQLGWGYREHEPRCSREEANEHAAGCHAKPKPSTA